MGALRAVQKLEEDFGEKLATVYGCEQDDLPFELDLLSLYNIDGEERQAILV